MKLLKNQIILKDLRPCIDIQYLFSLFKKQDSFSFICENYPEKNNQKCEESDKLYLDYNSIIPSSELLPFKDSSFTKRYSILFNSIKTLINQQKENKIVFVKQLFHDFS